MERGEESLAAKEVQCGNLASRIINIDGKVVGNEGLLRKAMRNVNMAAPGTFVTPIYGENSTKTPYETNNHKGSGDKVCGDKLSFVSVFKEPIEEVLENGPWLIRLVPIFLNIWTPNTRLSKEAITNAPIWVKLHNVPVVAYSEGRNDYACALIEVSSITALKESVVVVIPFPNGSEHSLETVKVLVIKLQSLCSNLLYRVGSKDVGSSEVSYTQIRPNDGKTLLIEGPVRKTSFINDEVDVMSLKNSFETLMEADKVLDSAVVDKGPDEDDYKVDDDDVEEVFVEKPRVLNSKQTKELQKGASTPVTKGTQVLINYVLKCFGLGNGRRMVLFMIKGLQIILGWNLDIVNVVVISFDDRVMHTCVHFKADRKDLLCTSFVDTAMQDFQECVEDIEVTNNKATRVVAAYLNAFNEATRVEERFLQQKAKVKWLKSGDANNVYFHKVVKNQASRNRIDNITLNNGDILTDDQVPRAFIDHYTTFLGQQAAINPLNSNDLFQNQILNEVADHMVREVSNHEIMEAIFSIGDDKAPGLDAYSIAFFKEAWDIIAHDVIKAIREVFVNGVLLKELNHTIIALIPKVATPMRINDYRPISCCNVLFKCISLLSVLLKWTFKRFMIRLIGIFLRSINGGLHGYFKRKRGLRPMSPYLFTLVMEILTLMLNKRVRESESFTYHRYCSKLNIINLCFADDLFLFAHGDANSARVIMDSLEEFKDASGLSPSLPKSTTVPLMPSRLIYRDCSELVEKVRKRIKDWKNKSLSFVGDMRRGKDKVAWEIVCLPKHEGGLGIRRLEAFNQALISTHIWSILALKETLWVKWIHIYKLQGRSLWDIPLRDYVSNRDIYEAGFLKTAKLDAHATDTLVWRKVNDEDVDFSVATAWESIRPRCGPIRLGKWASIFVNIWFNSAPSKVAPLVSEAFAGLVLLIRHKTSDSEADISFDIPASLGYVSGLGLASPAKVISHVSPTEAPAETIPHYVPQF
ncbi:hypothetical protein Tco_1377343 [Tanacetum coccineum]